MYNLSELLKAFPALWFFAGAGIAYLFIFKLARVYKEQVAAIITERNDYREKLHVEKANHQSTLLENQTLRERPDLSSLSELLRKQSEVMLQISDSFREHSDCDAKIFSRIEESISSIQETLQAMGSAFSRQYKAKRQSK